MKLDRLLVFKALNIAVVIASVAACIFIAAEAEKKVDTGLYYIAPKISDSALYFSAQELNELKEISGASSLAYETVSGGRVTSSGTFNVHSKLIHTNSYYFGLNNTQFLHGGGWSGDRERENLIVVNESLAWQLFGSVSVVDKEVFISNEGYTIVGVIEQEQVSRDSAAAYITMNPAPDDKRIANIFIKAENYNKLGTYTDISEFFRETGRDIRDYYIIDLNRYIENIGMKYKLLIFAIGVYSAAIIIINSYKLLRNSRLNQKSLLILAAILLLDVIFIVLLIRGISFEVWILHSDNSRVTETIRAITNSGFLPSGEYLTDGLRALSRLNAYANTALALGAAALFNFVFAHKGVPLHGKHKPD